MPEFLITFRSSRGEQAQFFNWPDKGGEDLLLEVIANYERRADPYSYSSKFWACPPTYTYSRVDKDIADADYLLYRRTDDNNLLYIGAVRCEIADPGVRIAELYGDALRQEDSS